jgi:hypothetical protein
MTFWLDALSFMLETDASAWLEMEKAGQAV